MRWKKKSSSATTNHLRSLLSSSSRPLLLLFVTFLLLLFIYYYATLKPQLSRNISTSSSSAKSTKTQFPQCSLNPMGDQKFLFYAPHSGFSNQLAEFKNAVLMAAVLNRTLIVPPVLDHHAVALGSCPKFRVSSPSELRGSVWDHIMELIQSRRYVAMNDIVDLSSLLSSSVVKTIDFRIFASMWCDLKMDLVCSSWESFTTNLKQCRSLLSGMEGNIRNCVYAVEEDCRTTVWTYKRSEDGILDSFQPDKELWRKKKISFVRKHRDVYRAFGPGSFAEKATVLSFGSLFSSPYRGSELYIDTKTTNDPRILSLLQKIEFLPFVEEITSAGKDYVMNKIKESFLCAQLRLLDGQFKNHWKATFSILKQKIKSLQLEHNGSRLISIFVMTDLPPVNWTGSYLAGFVSDTKSFKLYTLQEGEEYLLQSAKNVLAAEHGLRSSFIPASHDIIRKHEQCDLLLPDISLYLEEVICSCASLGFVGTPGSTIAESIELMRKNDNCIISSPS